MKKPGLEGSTALKLKYIQILRSFMWFIGAWPSEELRSLGEPRSHLFSHLFSRLMRFYLPINDLILLSVQCNLAFSSFNDLSYSDKGLLYLNFTLNVLTLVRLTIYFFKKYGVLVKYFIARVHLFNHRNKSAFCLQTYKKVNKFCDIFTRYSMVMMLIGSSFFNISPIYVGYKNTAYSGNTDDLEFSLIYKIPGLDMKEHYIFFTLWNWFITVQCGIAVCGSDTLLSLMVFNLIGHIMILSHDLEDIPKPKKQGKVVFLNSNGDVCEAPVEMYDEEENENIHKILTQCIEYHKFIISAIKDISEFFGPILGINYLANLMQCCVLLLQCSQNDAAELLCFGPLTLIIFSQLIQLSVSFEYVGTISEKLNDIVYQLSWECMDTRNRRVVYILLQRVQTPINVTAMGLTTVGVTTMSKILKATFSYFTFLRSMV